MFMQVGLSYKSGGQQANNTFNLSRGHLRNCRPSLPSTSNKLHCLLRGICVKNLLKELLYESGRACVECVTSQSSARHSNHYISTLDKSAEMLR